MDILYLSIKASFEIELGLLDFNMVLKLRSRAKTNFFSNFELLFFSMVTTSFWPFFFNFFFSNFEIRKLIFFFF
jgi:hypothetical protein